MNNTLLHGNLHSNISIPNIGEYIPISNDHTAFIKKKYIVIVIIFYKVKPVKS